MEKTKIKAVQLVRRIRDAQHEQLKDKTWEERVAFYKEQARTLHADIDRKNEIGDDGKEAK